MPGQALFIDTRRECEPGPGSPNRIIIPACSSLSTSPARTPYLEGASVYQARSEDGRKLAKTFRRSGLSEADVVDPRCPTRLVPRRWRWPRNSGLPYREALVKNRYVGRTFIMPDEGERRRSIRRKLNAIEDEFRDRSVLLVDDSIVRGNTSRQIVQLARRAGAKKVYFASTSPPLIHPCVYGIDMSTRREFIARDRTHAEIATQLGADAVVYQELEDLVDSVKEGQPGIRQMCDACFSGNYPTGDITPEMLRLIEEERITQGK